MSQTMRGAVLLKHGEHYHLEVRNVPIPPVREGEVLIRVHAAAISHMDESFLHGLSNQRVEGLRETLGQDVLTGIELSGVVQTDGVRFKKGDEVIAYIHVLQHRRTHAEYTALPETTLAPKPKNVTHVEAASMPANCLTAYEALTNVAPVGQGQRVLVVGGSGSLGVHAIQFARFLGAEVAAIANPAVLDKVRAIGAQEVFDYTKSIGALPSGFDLVFDTAPAYSFKQCEPLLKSGGTYIHTLPSKDAEGFELAKQSTKKAGYLMVLEVKGDGLDRVSQLIEKNAFKPVIDRVYPLDEVAAAHEHFSTKGKVGKVVIDIAG